MRWLFERDGQIASLQRVREGDGFLLTTQGPTGVPRHRRFDDLVEVILAQIAIEAQWVDQGWLLTEMIPCEPGPTIQPLADAAGGGIDPVPLLAHGRAAAGNRSRG